MAQKVKWIDQRLTSDMLKVLEAVQTQMAKGEKWEMPWQRFGMQGMPVNGVTGKFYRGMNVFTLGISGMPSNKFASIKQWGSAGHMVKQEEIDNKAGFPVVYFNFVESKKEPGKKFPILKWSFVFNESQLTDYVPETQKPIENPAENIPYVDEFVKNTGASVRTGEARAYYAPGPDYINMPAIDLFKDTKGATATENYYSTLLHELTHWTGHDSRCKRDFGGAFGSKLYAFEELVAELGSALACAQLGVTPYTRPDHGAYLASWIKGLREDPTALRKAAGLAQKSFDHLQELQPVE